MARPLLCWGSSFEPTPHTLPRRFTIDECAEPGRGRPWRDVAVLPNPHLRISLPSPAQRVFARPVALQPPSPSGRPRRSLPSGDGRELGVGGRCGRRFLTPPITGASTPTRAPTVLQLPSRCTPSLARGRRGNPPSSRRSRAKATHVLDAEDRGRQNPPTVSGMSARARRTKHVLER